MVDGLCKISIQVSTDTKFVKIVKSTSNLLLKPYDATNMIINFLKALCVE